TIRFSSAPILHVPLLEPVITLTAVDLDRDGDRDLIAVTGSPRIVVWLNNGFGSFALRLNPISSFLDPHSQVVPDAVSCPPSPALQFVSIPIVGIDQARVSLVSAVTGAVRIVAYISSPRAPPAFLLS